MRNKRRFIVILVELGMVHGLYAAADDEEKSIRDLKGFPNFEAPIIVKRNVHGGYTLDFKNQGFTNLDGLDKVNIDLDRVTMLNFCKNKILSILDDTFGVFSKLKSLMLSDNQLTYIPAALATLSGIKDLVINDNQISAVDSYPLENLKQLRILLLDSNNIEYVDPAIISILSSRRDITIDLMRNRITQEHKKEIEEAFIRLDNGKKGLHLANQRATLDIPPARNTKRAKR